MAGLLDRYRLNRRFMFTTDGSINACIENLHLLNPINYRELLLPDEVAPSFLFDIDIFPSNDNTCYYSVALQEGEASASPLSRLTGPAFVYGKIEHTIASGKTYVTGQSGIVIEHTDYIVYALIGFVLSILLVPWLALLVLVPIGHWYWLITRDQSRLIREVYAACEAHEG